MALGYSWPFEAQSEVDHLLPELFSLENQSPHETRKHSGHTDVASEEQEPVKPIHAQRCRHETL